MLESYIPVSVPHELFRLLNMTDSKPTNMNLHYTHKHEYWVYIRHHSKQAMVGMAITYNSYYLNVMYGAILTIIYLIMSIPVCTMKP